MTPTELIAMLRRRLESYGTEASVDAFELMTLLDEIDRLLAERAELVRVLTEKLTRCGGIWLTPERNAYWRGRADALTEVLAFLDPEVKA